MRANPLDNELFSQSEFQNGYGLFFTILYNKRVVSRITYNLSNAIIKEYKYPLISYGADNENRTRILSLEGFRFTIKLYPLFNLFFSHSFLSKNCSSYDD